MLRNMSDYIGTRIQKGCECPERVADRWNGFGRVIGNKIRAKLDWHLNLGSLRVTRKCHRPMHWLEFKKVFSSIDTIILEVCECPESVTEQWNGLGRVGVCVCVCVCVHTCVCIYDRL